MKNYTLQFCYNEKDYSYPVHSDHKYKPTMNLDDIVQNIAKSVLEWEGLDAKVEELQHLRFFGKEGELLWSADNK